MTQQSIDHSDDPDFAAPHGDLHLGGTNSQATPCFRMISVEIDGTEWLIASLALPKTLKPDAHAVHHMISPHGARAIAADMIKYADRREAAAAKMAAEALDKAKGGAA